MTAVEVGRVGAADPPARANGDEITLSLRPGNYVLICNLPDHYQAGQHAAFRVRG